MNVLVVSNITPEMKQGNTPGKGSWNHLKSTKATKKLRITNCTPKNMKVFFTVILCCSLLIFQVQGNCSPVVYSRQRSGNGANINVTLLPECSRGTIKWYFYTWPGVRLNINVQRERDFQLCLQRRGGFSYNPQLYVADLAQDNEQPLTGDEVCFYSDQRQVALAVRSIEVLYGAEFNYRIQF